MPFCFHYNLKSVQKPKDDLGFTTLPYSGKTFVIMSGRDMMGIQTNKKTFAYLFLIEII
jgi:hypothetical protein